MCAHERIVSFVTNVDANRLKALKAESLRRNAAVVRRRYYAARLSHHMHFPDAAY